VAVDEQRSAAETLQTIIQEHYAFESVGMPRYLEQAHQRRHRKLVVETSKGRFLVKTYKRDPVVLDNLRFQHRLSDHLDQHGLPVARIEPAADGKRIIEMDDWAIELQEFVELSGIPFYTTPQGRGVIPEDHPLSFLGARNQAWKEADVVLIVGTRLNFIIGFGLPPRFAEDVKIIQIDICDEEIGRNRPVDLGIVGDAKMVLQQLIEEGRATFQGRKELPWIDTLRGYEQRSQEKAQALLNSEQTPIHPLRLCKEVRDFMDRDAIIVVDGHEILNFARQSIPTHVPGHRVNAGPNGCMGVAVPFGLGAKVAKPNTQVIVLSGDGSFGMNGMEIDTMMRHNIPALIVINNNGGWAAVGGMAAGRDLGFSRYEKMAEAFGAHAEYVERPQDIRPALERAAASGKPAVINVITDPNARSSTVSFAAYRAI